MASEPHSAAAPARHGQLRCKNVSQYYRWPPHTSSLRSLSADSTWGDPIHVEVEDIQIQARSMAALRARVNRSCLDAFAIIPSIPEDSRDSDSLRNSDPSLQEEEMRCMEVNKALLSIYPQYVSLLFFHVFLMYGWPQRYAQVLHHVHGNYYRQRRAQPYFQHLSARWVNKSSKQLFHIFPLAATSW